MALGCLILGLLLSVATMMSVWTVRQGPVSQPVVSAPVRIEAQEGQPRPEPPPSVHTAVSVQPGISFIALFVAMGLPLLMGTVLGWLSFGLSPTYRRRLLSNAAQAGYGLSQVWGAVAQAGRMTAELPRLWLGAPVPIVWDGAQVLEDAYRQGRGVVFLTPHMGCFEVMAQAVAARFSAQHGPLTVLYRPARQPWLARVMDGAISDDNGQPLSETAIGAIARDLLALYDTLDARDLSAGSPQARRLFS